MNEVSGQTVIPSNLSSEPDRGEGSDQGVTNLAREGRVGHLLRRAYGLAKEHSTAGLRGHDVTPRQSAAIQSIFQNESMSQAELGEAIGMEPANVHGLVDRLKKKGLIAAERDPANPRRMRLTLTGRGKALHSRVLVVADESEEATLARLSPRERAQLVTLLRKLLA